MNTMVFDIIIAVAIFLVITLCFAIVASICQEIKNRIIRRREWRQERDFEKEKRPTCGKPIEKVKNA